MIYLFLVFGFVGLVGIVILGLAILTDRIIDHEKEAKK